MAQTPERKREWFKEYYLKNREVLLAKSRKWKAENEERIRENGRKRRWLTPENELFKAAKSRAKRNDIPFNISVEDIVVPTHCPVLGIPIFKIGKLHDNSPTLDRLDNDKGYVKGNINVISWRANRIKNDSTLSELEQIVEYLANISGEQSLS